MDFFLICVPIAVIAIFLFNVFFKPKFECPECKTVHSKGNAKSQKATETEFSHTRKDGNRDRRFNQTGIQHYDLTFDCKSCKKEFIVDYGGSIDYFFEKWKEKRLNKFAKQALKDNPKLEKDLRALDDAWDELKKELDKR